jgi:exosortase/archaeosortase
VKLKAVPKEYRDKVRFTLRLLAFGVLFYALWSLGPNLQLLKLLTATLVSLTTGGTLIAGADGVFVRRGDFLLQVVTDCTAWKEVSVFLALFLSWPKKKSYRNALVAVAAILVYNLLRLDLLLLFSGSFDYFHPAFQYASIAVILLLWAWSVGLVRLRAKFPWLRGKRKYKKRKKRKK